MRLERYYIPVPYGGGVCSGFSYFKKGEKIPCRLEGIWICGLATPRFIDSTI